MKTIDITSSNAIPSPFPSGRNGVTLVEMLTALLIFALAIGGLCSLAVSAKQILDTSRDHYVAVNLAKNRIERVKTFNFNELNLFVEAGTILDESGAPDPAGSYSRATAVSNVTASLKEVVVTISIKHRKTLKFAPAQQQVRTYIADISGAE
ncbi:MAG: prepilin-type N-terminal cleavage/methylation domain-containing protein [Verrucomicrobia bacterium]|nr:prepilin-type N-terminal cleavage/methylation domain-containing protein [Verrucomicrobiota bacterium]